MPTPATTVGPQSIPVPAGLPQAVLPDVVESGLLDYFAFWIKYTLDSKLATMTAPPITDACPVANRSTTAPSAIFVAFQTPALFCWWDGKSTIQEATLTYNFRIRDIKVMWVYSALANPDLMNTYSGLVNAVDGALATACMRGAHPSYKYGSFGYGTHVRDMLGLRGIEYMGGSEGLLADLAQTSARAVNPGASRGDKGPLQRGFPAFFGTVKVTEQLGRDTRVDPTDNATDLLVSIKTSEDGTEPFVIRQGYLDAPDGSESL